MLFGGQIRAEALNIARNAFFIVRGDDEDLRAWMVMVGRAICEFAIAELSIGKCLKSSSCGVSSTKSSPRQIRGSVLQNYTLTRLW